MTTDHIQTAYEWHGGQWSALYSYASTGGKVHSEEHHALLEIELHDCITQVEQQFQTETERKQLYALRDFICRQPTEWGIFT